MSDGYWRFNDQTGAILNWWPSTGTYNFQGPPPAKRALESAFFSAVISARGQEPSLTRLIKDNQSPDELETREKAILQGNSYEQESQV